MRRKIIGITLLCVALSTVGCNKESEVVENNKESIVESNTSSKKEKLKKIQIENLSMKVSKNWEDKSVDNMLLYKIGEYDNFSIITDLSEGSNLDEYVESAKTELSAVIDMSNVSIEKEAFNGYEARTMSYKYNVEGVDVKVYQVCFMDENLSYILTLCSEENNIDNNVKVLKEYLDTLKIK